MSDNPENQQEARGAEGGGEESDMDVLDVHGYLDSSKESMESRPDMGHDRTLTTDPFSEPSDASIMTSTLEDTARELFDSTSDNSDDEGGRKGTTTTLTGQAPKQSSPSQSKNNNNDHPALDETTRPDRRTRNRKKNRLCRTQWAKPTEKTGEKNNNNDQQKKQTTTGNQPAEGWEQQPETTDKRPQKWKEKSNRWEQQTKSKNQWTGETSRGTKNTTKEDTRRNKNAEIH